LNCYMKMAIIISYFLQIAFGSQAFFLEYVLHIQEALFRDRDRISKKLAFTNTFQLLILF